MRARSRDPILCLITDRRRACAGADLAGALECLVAQARWAVRAGIDLIQIRERDLDARVLAGLVSRILDVACGTRTRVVVNDRIDVAIACGADGVHLRADSAPAARTRAIVPAPFLIGCSVHGAGEAPARADGADYVIAGTVYATSSKPGRVALLGCEGLEQVVAAVTVPVLAVGGVTVDRAGDVARTGADGLAAIGLFIDDTRAGDCRVGPLDAVVVRLRRAFAQAAG